MARALIRIARLKAADSSIKRAATRAAGMRRIADRLVWPSVPEWVAHPSVSSFHLVEHPVPEMHMHMSLCSM